MTVASCIAALYTKGLIKENHLSAYSNASETIFTNVEVHTNLDSTAVGWDVLVVNTC
jgi:hypothetical protein